jgi:hypothetical protein|tara:strand:+ start:299 stop:649 length:351 start_codon:yes stop_codon:yes gene_type:complete
MLATLTERKNKKNRHKFTFVRCFNGEISPSISLKFYCVEYYRNYGEEKDRIKMPESIDIWINTARWNIEIDGEMEEERFIREYEREEKKKRAEEEEIERLEVEMMEDSWEWHAENE